MVPAVIGDLSCRFDVKFIRAPCRRISNPADAVDGSRQKLREGRPGCPRGATVLLKHKTLKAAGFRIAGHTPVVPSSGTLRFRARPSTNQATPAGPAAPGRSSAFLRSGGSAVTMKWFPAHPSAFPRTGEHTGVYTSAHSRGFRASFVSCLICEPLRHSPNRCVPTRATRGLLSDCPRGTNAPFSCATNVSAPPVEASRVAVCDTVRFMEPVIKAGCSAPRA